MHAFYICSYLKLIDNLISVLFFIELIKRSVDSSVMPDTYQLLALIDIIRN